LAPAILLVGLIGARMLLRRPLPEEAPHELSAMPVRLPAQTSRTSPGSTEVVDVEAEFRAVIGRLAPTARANLTHLRYAFRQAGMAQVDTEALHDVLTSVVATAIRACFGGQILLTARPLGRWIEVAVTDDAPIRGDATRQVLLEEARTAAASRGWLFSVDTRHDFGTTVSIRLPAAETALQVAPMQPSLLQDSRAGELRTGELRAGELVAAQD
jgi:hypothetical protein